MVDPDQGGRRGELIADNAAVVVMCRLQEDVALRPLEFQKSISVTYGGMSKLIDRLEERGSVARLAAKPAEDGRGVQVVLTKKGKDVLRNVLAAIAPGVRQVGADLVRILADDDDGQSQRGPSDPGADRKGA